MLKRNLEGVRRIEEGKIDREHARRKGKKRYRLKMRKKIEIEGETARKLRKRKQNEDERMSSRKRG